MFFFQSVIPRGESLILTLNSNGCRNTKNEINYLEHVQAVVSVQSNTRGSLLIRLRSPMGTVSTILDKRMKDDSPESFIKWPFTTVHMWGEYPHGKWTMEIINESQNSKIFVKVYFK